MLTALKGTGQKTVGFQVKHRYLESYCLLPKVTFWANTGTNPGTSNLEHLEVDKGKTGPENPKISFRLFLSFMLKGFLVRQRCHKQVYLHNLIDFSFTSKRLGTT